MKNILGKLVLILNLVAVTGCDDTFEHNPKKQVQPGVTEVVIENCQYLFMENGGTIDNRYAMTLTHKGNCTNSIHQCNYTTSPAP